MNRVHPLRVLPAVLLVGILGACGGGDGSGGQDPDEGAARLEQQRPEIDRAGASLGDALVEALGGTTETGPTEYPVCSSSPVDGLQYAAQWRIRDADPAPTLDAATDAAVEAGWEVGDTSPAEGFIPESVALRRAGVDARLSVDEGVVAWSAETRCIRVTAEEADRLVGPAS